MERVKGLEPSTPTLARLYSTTELHPQKNYYFFELLFFTGKILNQKK